MPNWTKEQSDAINKDGSNIIVSAGAGSGKTAVLSERVLRKLKEGVNIDELLILTFTKAAAKEMKERIRKKIKKDPSLNSQLELVDAAYITTFDSYSLSVLKKYHYILNLSPNIKITDSSIVNIKKEKILDEIFEELYDKKDKKFENLIRTFCIKDDKEIRKYILSIYSKLELKTNKLEYLKNYIEEYFNECKVRSDIDNFEQLLISKITEINEILDELSFVSSSEYFYKVKDALNPFLSSKLYEEFLFNSNISLPNLPRGSSDDEKKLKKRLNDEKDALISMLKYDTKEEIYESIMLTKEYVKSIIDIILILDKKLNIYKKENNLYEFNDIANLSIKILKENEDIRNEIKNHFNEIMIDEYQDTNDVQEEFISLISNNNVYMVGDIKQSIYRFRNANPYIFKNKYDNYKVNNGGIKIDLNKNFRSREEVLNNINDIFKFIMDDDIGGADYKVSHEMIFGNVTYNEEGKTSQNNDFEIYNYAYDPKSLYKKEEIEAFIIANDIKNKINNKYKIFDKDELIVRDVNYNDFVILMDKSTNFDLYKKIFEYLNVPLSIEKDESIINEMVLVILKNLLTLIYKVYKKEIDDEFKYMFLSIVRSPLFEMDDDLIFDIFKTENFKDNELYKEVLEISKKLDYIDISSLINIIVEKFNFYENIIKIGNINSNITIIDYLKSVSESFIKDSNNIYDFINYLNDLTEKGYDIKINRNKDSSDSVKIMTIHKSKGLEYHICYYSGLYSNFNIKELNDKFMFDNKYGIISPYFKEGIDSTIYKDLVKANYIKEEISEKIRLFYVALTRAKEKMILITNLKEEFNNSINEGIVRGRIKYRSFNDILLSIKTKLDKYIKDIDIEKLNLSKDYMLIKKNNYLNYINITDEKLKIKEIEVKNEIVEEETYSKKQSKILTKEEIDGINLGLQMHSILEIVDFKINNLDKINTTAFIKNKVIKFLQNDILKNIEDGKIYKEYEFMYEKENKLFHGIIDLMIIYDDYIDIIDYKLKNITDDNYLKQLNGYKNYIEGKTKKKVNIYLYSIINEEIRCLN